jgi:hypothetical protein
MSISPAALRQSMAKSVFSGTGMHINSDKKSTHWESLKIYPVLT